MITYIRELTAAYAYHRAADEAPESTPALALIGAFLIGAMFALSCIGNSQVTL